MTEENTVDMFSKLLSFGGKLTLQHVTFFTMKICKNNRGKSDEHRRKQADVKTINQPKGSRLQRTSTVPFKRSFFLYPQAESHQTCLVFYNNHSRTVHLLFSFTD